MIASEVVGVSSAVERAVRSWAFSATATAEQKTNRRVKDVGRCMVSAGEENWVGNCEPIRPHRKDAFVYRSRVQVRIDDDIIERLDRLANSLRLSRAHFCDL